MHNLAVGEQMEEERKKTTRPVQSVERALFLFRHIADHVSEEHSLRSLSGLIDINRSSTFRLLQTLVQQGLLRQEGARYRLGPALYRFVSALEQQERQLLGSLQPVLQEISQQCGENAHAAIKYQDKALFIAREIGGARISANTAVGDTEDLYCTAIGRSLICHYNQAQLEECFRETDFRKYTPKTVTDMAQVYRLLTQIREDWVSVDDGEFEEDIYCLASPIYNHQGEVIAALGLSGLRKKIKPNFSRFSSLLKKHARELSAKFGFNLSNLKSA